MSEGSLKAPIRHPVDWQNPDFFDEEKLDAELRRVFDLCHGCRRCFNLCDSFPRLFDMIDATESGELHDVGSDQFKPVVDACTLCDLCFMTKCPYVPPHDFDLDFPHLMLRYRAIEHRRGKTPLAVRELTKTDRNGKLAGPGRPYRQLGVGHRQYADPAGAGSGRRNPPRCPSAEVPRQDLRASGEVRRAEAQPRSAGVRPQGGALRHLLRQLQQSVDRDSRARRAGP